MLPPPSKVPPPRLDLPPEESTDLEELEQFAKMFKQKRIKLGELEGGGLSKHLGHTNSP